MYAYFLLIALLLRIHYTRHHAPHRRIDKVILTPITEPIKRQVPHSARRVFVGRDTPPRLAGVLLRPCCQPRGDLIEPPRINISVLIPPSSCGYFCSSIVYLLPRKTSQ